MTVSRQNVLARRLSRLLTLGHAALSKTLLLLPLVIFSLSAACVAAETTGTAAGRETGLSIPRFVSLGVDRARMRVGPGTLYRIKWIYQKMGLPLEIVAEFGNWRKVRDHAGAQGWMHHALLSGRRTAMVAPWGEVAVPLRTDPSFDASMVARLEPEVLVTLESCGGSWCRVFLEEQEISGHIRQTELWGAYPGEVVE